jgi:hypothetical protein
MADCEICHEREMRFFDQDFEAAVCAECRNELNEKFELPGALKALLKRRWVGATKQGRCDVCNDRSIRVHSPILAIATCLTCSERLRRRAVRDVVFEPFVPTSKTHASAYHERETSDRHSPPPPNDTEESSPRSPYEVLGITASATIEEVKAAYRRLAKMYHPDRVADLGPEFGVLAERRMKEINAAYAQLEGSW